MSQKGKTSVNTKTKYPHSKLYSTEQNEEKLGFIIFPVYFEPSKIVLPSQYVASTRCCIDGKLEKESTVNTCS